MIRHFFISDNLQEIAEVEHELEESGFSKSQIHVLSDNDAEVYLHDLPQVESILKKDIVHSTELGAICGLLAASLTLLFAYIAGWTQTQVGWLPFIFLAIVVLGFCTWEGGLIGIQANNIHFEQFKEVLKKGKHLLFIDIEPIEEPLLANVMKTHPQLADAGTGQAPPSWLIRWRDRYRQFVKMMP